MKASMFAIALMIAWIIPGATASNPLEPYSPLFAVLERTPQFVEQIATSSVVCGLANSGGQQFPGRFAWVGSDEHGNPDLNVWIGSPKAPAGGFLFIIGFSCTVTSQVEQCLEDQEICGLLFRVLPERGNATLVLAGVNQYANVVHAPHIVELFSVSSELQCFPNSC